MYLFDLRNHVDMWNKFIEQSDVNNATPSMTDTQFNIWLERELEKHNAVDIPDDGNRIYFRSEEDATIFIIKFS